MAVCLDYQAVPGYAQPTLSVRWQVLAALVLLMALAFKVWVKVQTTEFGYQLAQEREITVEYDMQLRDLKLQHSILLRPDNLARAANERLGLVPLDPQYARRVSLRSGGQ